MDSIHPTPHQAHSLMEYLEQIPPLVHPTGER